MDQPTILSQLPVPTSDSPPETPIQPSERTLEKFIIIFLIVAMLFCSGIYVFALTKEKSAPSPSPTPPIVHSPTATPIPNPTANWKTYQDRYYEDIFSIQYPPTWKTQSDDLNKYISFTSPDYNASLGEGMIITITVSDTTTNDIEQWFSDYQSDAKGPESVHISKTIKRMQVGEVPAIQYDVTLDAGSTVTSLIKNNKLFTISSLWPNANLLDNKQVMDAQAKIYNQILSTFKFIEQTPFPTCRPRPACLDATPRCMIAETEDMCPKTK